MGTFGRSLSLLLIALPLIGKEGDAVERLNAAASVLSDVTGEKDKSIPANLLAKASCIVVVPSLKTGAFVVGAKYGKGFISCRKGRGWSAPGSIRIEGGSIGFQAGGSATDVIMLVLNRRGGQRLLSSQFTLGGQGEVAAGPVGRSSTAQTDATMMAKILSWSRSRGIFAGISLQGATLRQDIDDNAELYGKRLTNKQVIASAQWPQSGSEFESVLNRFSRRARARYGGK